MAKRHLGFLPEYDAKPAPDIQRDHEESGIRKAPALGKPRARTVRRKGGHDEIDGTTLEGCIRGDGVCFRRFMAFYKDRLYQFLRPSCRDGSDVDDIAMETFMRVHKAFRTFSLAAGVKPFTWLAKIARNVLLDRRRAEQRSARGFATFVPKSALLDPERDLLMRESLRRLEEAIARLPPEQCQAFVLRAKESASFEEIALIMDTPVGTAKSRYRAAVNQLALAIRGDGDEDEA